ncbi:MAG: 3-phosphoshikimate 1-carboxyvinyltransferase [Bacteroidota bacterium]|nr:3-phosphoshikimate 1-carboxyvinyltransferase [Bacteroidota bacterium]
MSIVRISHPTKRIKARITVPGSKSESNRLLILNALSGNKLTLENLSTARDTRQLVQILSEEKKTIDVLDAGTSMRFLTGYYCASNQHKIITGSERMKERPIGPLVSALSEIGFDVRYLDKEGFPPIEIVPVKFDRLEKEAFIEGNVSSQFITALLLIAPSLPNGLRLNFTTELTSRPYIEMTLQILQNSGVKYDWTDNVIEVKPHKLQTGAFSVGGDWSSASYWYSIAFLAEEAEIFLEGMKDDWTQGDQAIVDWMKRFGVITEFNSQGALLRKIKVEYPKLMKMSFKDNPDLAQTFAAMFAAKNIYATFNGVETLKIKETDRIEALRNELRKFNVHFDYSEMYEFYQLKGTVRVPEVPIKTYNDHRMAMSFAPLGLLGEIHIEDPQVVEKSYPTFWSDLVKAGFKISSIQ